VERGGGVINWVGAIRKGNRGPVKASGLMVAATGVHLRTKFERNEKRVRFWGSLK